MANKVILFVAFFTYAVLTGKKWKDTKHYLIYFVLLSIILLIIKKCTDCEIINKCFPDRDKSSILILLIAGIFGIFVGRKLKNQEFEFIPKDLKINTSEIISWK